MTLRLELFDATVRTWDALVMGSSREEGIELDRSAFYPGGGGQPPDDGVLLWGGVTTRVTGRGRGSLVRLMPHDEDPVPPVGTPVRGALDDARRTSLMRAHSALHVLSAVVLRDLASPVTGSGMDVGVARLDIDLPDAPQNVKSLLETACHDVIRADLSIRVRHVPAALALADPALHRSSESRLPAGLSEVRLVEIVGLDTQADAGTHVASTAAIGEVRISKIESKGRGSRRIRLALSER